MIERRNRHSHAHRHGFESWRARDREGVVVETRRGFLKTGLAGIAGLGLADLLHSRSLHAAESRASKSVILLWMAGGPSHIDTLDPKPGRPIENRGPFGVIQTQLPTVFVCEHLPKIAARLDQYTIIRSVDARHSNHEPNTVFQTGRLDAEPRTNPSADRYPAIGSIVAKQRGAIVGGMPAYVAFQTSRSHLAYAGDLGAKFDPFIANRAAKLPIYNNIGVDTGRATDGDFFQLPGGLESTRMRDRMSLRDRVDALAAGIERTRAVEAMGQFERQAVELLLGPKARLAFDLERESERARKCYGKHLWLQQALLARRLVEAGAAFVTLDLSYHTASGTWDTHGDNIPPYGGIGKGLKPLLPLFDHLFTTLVDDLTERGLIEDVLVIAMGEFGRTPRMGTQGSTDGRDHWPNVASMLIAGGGLRHGQIIGASEPDGGYIAARPVSPGDLAATIFQHMDVPYEQSYIDNTGRPRPYVEQGRPIAELF